MEKYIITGGTGYLGNTLVHELLKDNQNSIKLLVLENDDISMYANDKVDIRFGNILNPKFLNAEIEENSIVIHAAGIIDISSDNKDLLYKVNVEGTRNIAEISLKNKVKKFIYVSSVHAIETVDHSIMSEPTSFDPARVIGDYAKSKAMATKIVFDLVKQGLNAVVVYPSGIIGPNDIRVSNIGEVLLDIANRKITTRIAGGYNFVDVRDVADGIISAVNKGRIGEGYILSGNNVSIDELFIAVKERLHRRHLAPLISIGFVKMFAGIAEWFYKIQHKKPLFTWYSLYTITSNHEFNNQKAKKELNFKVRPSKETLQDMLNWLYKYKRNLFKPKVIGEFEGIK